ncbi:hypothetical protein [Nonomuraea sp. NPDC049709]|uniref:hypothetical protein n=1 Tax=Nonomuraea sp. NPDC049709 TaxID=3154736 RepID=UPI00341F9D99
MSPTALRSSSLGLALILVTGCAGPPEEFVPEAVWEETDEDEGTEADRAEICVRKATLVRAADQLCDDEAKGHTWYYLPLTAKIPAVGKKARSGTFDGSFDFPFRVSEKGGKGEDILIADDEDRIEICVRKSTRIRVRDDLCDDEAGGHEWYVLPLSSQIPAVGRKAVNGSFRPSDHTETFRARPGGGKGSKIAVEPPDDPGVTPPRTTTRPQQCTTITTGRITTRRCS